MRYKPLYSLVAASVLLLGNPLAAWADVNYDLIQAGFSGSPGQIGTLVSRGANINARDDYGYTPLMWAAQEGHVLTCEALIKHGADVNARDKSGRTALLIATVKGHTEVVRALLAHHADPAIKAKNGISATDYARIYRMSTIARMLDAASPMTHPALAHATPKPTAMPHMRASLPPMEASARPIPTPRPMTAPMTAKDGTGSTELSAATRDSVAKLHGRFMDHLGLRDPEAIVQKGFNQDLEDKLDQVFLALDYGHTSSMAKSKLADARKLINAAKTIASQPDPQDDKTCRQILASLDELLTSLNY